MFEQTANRSQRPAGDFGLIAQEIERVGHALGADFGNGNFDIDHFFELDGDFIIAVSVDARPADFLIVDFTDNAHPHAAQERMFGLFHVGEEVGEVNDPRHIGFPKLDAPAMGESFVHGVLILFQKYCDQLLDTLTRHVSPGSRADASGWDVFRWRRKQQKNAETKASAFRVSMVVIGGSIYRSKSVANVRQQRHESGTLD